jgi:hypothetical protein
MKAEKVTIEKEFDAVAYMRQERDRISRDIAGMGFREVQAYFSGRKLKGNVLKGKKRETNRSN